MQAAAASGNCLLRSLGTQLEDGGQYNLFRANLYSLYTVTGKYVAHFFCLTSFEMIRESDVTKYTYEKFNL